MQLATLIGNLRRASFVASLSLSAFLIGSCKAEPEPTSPCSASRFVYPVNAPRLDKLDVLFVVDNSASMAEEQVRLREQLPQLVRMLTTGQSPAHSNDFIPLRDVRIGFVTTDMSLPGVSDTTGRCRADGGDDGVLQHAGSGPDCQRSYPAFLTYQADTSLGPVTDAMRLATDIACVADVGSHGCGFEQSLEAPLRALSPAMQAAQGSNRGFLRNDIYAGLSYVAIVLVTNEDDCSLQSTEQLGSSSGADPHCLQRKTLLHDVMRYYEGFRSLRPGNEHAVKFIVIAGVPVDLVDAVALKAADLEPGQPSSYDAFYDSILNDARMREEVDPESLASSGEERLKPACTRAAAGQQGPVVAYPARRLVELAKLFGENGMVQSICQDDMSNALAPIAESIGAREPPRCFLRAFVREHDGTIPCDLIWELSNDVDESSAPVRCEDLPFLSPVGPNYPSSNARGGMNCKVAQVPVLDPASGEPPEGTGWYFDDFSRELRVLGVCVGPGEARQRIAYTAGARPPYGARARLVCERHTQGHPNTREDLAKAVVQPAIGTSCGAEFGSKKPTGDVACVQTLKNNTLVQDLFCHAAWQTCVKHCQSDEECPPGWGCDLRRVAIASGGDKGAYCVNLSCGDVEPPHPPGASR